MYLFIIFSVYEFTYEFIWNEYFATICFTVTQHHLQYLYRTTKNTYYKGELLSMCVNKLSAPPFYLHHFFFLVAFGWCRLHLFLYTLKGEIRYNKILNEPFLLLMYLLLFVSGFSFNFFQNQKYTFRWPQAQHIPVFCTELK